eukprot:EG_transcript_16978
MAEIHSKVYYYGVQGARKEIRRACHQHTELAAWADVTVAFGRLLGHEGLRLEYEDTDGDRVVLESQEEWEECLRAGPYTTANPLRLHATKRRAAKAEKDSSKCRKCPAKEEESQAAAEAESAPPSDGVPSGEPAPASSSAGTGEAAAIVQRYIQVSNTAAVPAEWLACAFTPTPSRDPRDVELDVDLDVFAACLCQKALALMEGNDNLKALQMLQEAFALRPRHETMYNIACCLAQLGRADEALQSLEASIAMGFAKYDHMLHDEDLASLRGDERFLALASLLYRGDDACSSDHAPNLTLAEETAAPTAEEEGPLTAEEGPAGSAAEVEADPAVEPVVVPEAEAAAPPAVSEAVAEVVDECVSE